MSIPTWANKRFSVFVASLFIFTSLSAHAESYNEDSCYKDYVTDKGKETVVAVNRDTGEVELCWSEQDSAWVKPADDDRQRLQRLYNKKVQLREMQSNMDRMRDDTWYTTDENIGSHR